MKSRVITLFLMISMLWVVILGRASYLQFLPHKRLNALQGRQFKTVVNLPARRGNIVDREGKELALSAPAYSIYADPSIIENPKWASKFISGVLKSNPKAVYSKLKDKDRKFVWIDRLVSGNLVDQIKNQKIRGIGFVEEWKRVYPNEYLLSNVLGFIGKEGQGLEGLELLYDKELRGENKKMTLMKDAKGRPIIQDGLMFKELPQGKDVKLTIDSDLQFFVETELMQAMKKHEADGAYAVVLDAKTSAIRALVSLPHYDLNDPQKYSAANRRNRSVTDAFEPGSTLKTFVLADAIEKKVYTPNSKIFCENGHFKIGKRVIREAEKNHSKGLITVTEILQYSSNIGTSKIALKMGDNEIRSMLLKFGFGQKSGVDMPGEVKGILQPLPWNDHLLANVSFGQGVTVTPVQMANAYAAIANGGFLNKPYIIESIKDPETGEEEAAARQTGERVLSEETTKKMKDMLVAVTSEEGTAYAARVPGYSVGGKTGTAQKVNPKGRGYIPGGYIGSMAGFIPANDPEYVIYVALDHPRKGYYGAAVAAPVFSSIASYAIRKEGMQSAPLAKKGDSRKISSVFNESPEVVGDENPDLAYGLKKEEVKDFTADDLVTESKILTSAPNLKNLSIREVIDRVNENQIKVRFIGVGNKVESTQPAEGEALDADRKMTIFLE